MLRLALLSLFAFAPAASAQTADVLEEITGFVDNLRHRSGPVSTITYDVTKLVKANAELNSADKVLARLTARGLILAVAGKSGLGDAVTILPRNKIAVRTMESVHARIREQLDGWQEPAQKKAAPEATRPNAPAAALPPPAGGEPPFVETAPKKKKR